MYIILLLIVRSIGGAIAAKSTGFTVRDSVFINNESNGYGGIIALFQNYTVLNQVCHNIHICISICVSFVRTKMAGN